jgi:hypothetical protein
MSGAGKSSFGVLVLLIVAVATSLEKFPLPKGCSLFASNSGSRSRLQVVGT